ncbi:MAG TPA: glucose-1-phosphate thymidylyltransferase [Candidatus Dormibacteraeota bacterium]|nr:glucose-1-phosphate thymidylyltransferase [Candidatus Dormibacteraeota bacterium]
MSAPGAAGDAVKGLILSGGKGTRLRPITHTSAKQLVPVANKPVLFYALEGLVAAGVEDIGVIIGETGDEVRAAVGDGSRFGARVTYIPQERPLGLAHAVMTARPFLADDRFVMFLGDNLIRDGVSSLVDEFRAADCDAMILLARVREPQRFGVAELEGTRVVRLVEKPTEPRSDLALVGVYLFTAAVHDAIASISPSPRGELEITDAIQRMIDDGRSVIARVIGGWWATGWKDTGNLEDLLEANRLVLETIETRIDGAITEDVRLEGRVIVEAGAVLRRSTIRGPAVIGERTVIEDAYIGPFTSIYHDCVVRHSEIEHSIVLANSRIENAPGKLDSSLIGRGSVVTRVERRPHGLKLLVGDDSRVELH